jgi:hypothetical protein
MRLLHNCLAASITLLALAQGLHAQQITIVPCNGTVDEVYCYVNNDDHSWHWQCDCGPVNLHFVSGNIESNYDHLRIYDGPDDVSPLLYQNGQEDLSGLEFISTGGNLFMQFNSNATNCCATDGLLGGGLSEWVFSASNGSVGIQEEQAGNFTMYPNPVTSELHLRLSSHTNGAAEVRILDVSGRVVYENSFTATAGQLSTFDLNALQNGIYSVVLATTNGVKTQSLQVIH